MFFRNDETFALQLNRSAVAQAFLALHSGSLILFVLGMYQDLYLDCQNCMNILRCIAQDF